MKHYILYWLDGRTSETDATSLNEAFERVHRQRTLKELFTFKTV